MKDDPVAAARPHDHLWDTEEEADVTYVPPEHMDQPWVIRCCCEPRCDAIKVTRLRPNAERYVTVYEPVCTYSERKEEAMQFVPCIESPDDTHAEWVVCNYLNTADIRFRGTYVECEAFIGISADV